jgi:hypothetical protein
MLENDWPRAVVRGLLDHAINCVMDEAAIAAKRGGK